MGVATTSTPAGAGTSEVRREQGHARAALARHVCEGDPHPARRAVPDEADAVERLARPSRGDEHRASRERAIRDGRFEQALDSSGDLDGLRHAPRADEPLGQLAVVGPDDLRAALDEEREIRLRRRVLPHRGVHRRREQQRPAVRERGLGEEVVGQPVGEPRHRVRRQRRDDEQVGIDEVRIRVGGLGLPRERAEGLGGDETLGAARRHRRDVVAGPDEQAHELAGLVGRDAAGHPDEDPRHGHIVPVTGPDAVREADLRRGSVVRERQLARAISSIAIVR